MYHSDRSPINHHQISNLIYKQIPHPVNPEILEILIQTIYHSDRYQLITVKLTTLFSRSISFPVSFRTTIKL
jgi:hypothetical protein